MTYNNVELIADLIETLFLHILVLLQLGNDVSSQVFFDTFVSCQMCQNNNFVETVDDAT